MRHSVLLAALSGLALCAAVAMPARAEEVTVMISGGFSAAYEPLVAEFERATHHHVTTVHGASMGATPTAIPNRLARGEPADMVILAGPALDELIKDGKVTAASKRDLAISLIGLAVRAGAARPRIGTLEELKQTLLAARSITYSSSASGVYLVTTLFPRLGIAGAVKDKSRMVTTEPAAAVVARGEAEVALQQISELLPVPGVELVGPLPAEAQLVTPFSAGITASTEHPQAAGELLAYLTSPAAATVIARSGMEPATR